MTRLLEQVLAEVRKLSDEEQDQIAAELIAYLSTTSDGRDPQLSDQQLAELRRRRVEPNPQNLKLEDVEAHILRRT